MVWFQIETFPNFDKLYGEIDGKLTKGTEYTFTVDHKSDYSDFDVKKYIVLSTTSFTGKNLGLIFIFGGAFLYVIFLIIGFSVLEYLKQNDKLCWD